MFGHPVRACLDASGDPLLCFFDDFGPIIPNELAERALADFAAFCSKLGAWLKAVKSEYGQKIAFLGLLGHFPCSANNLQPPSPSRLTKLRDGLKRFRVTPDNVPSLPRNLESLSASWASRKRTASANLPNRRFAPCKKFPPRNFSPNPLSDLRTLRRRADVLSSLLPRIPRPANRYPDAIIHTEADLLAQRMAALALSSDRSGVKTELLAVSQISSARFELFHKRNPIIGMEMSAPMAILRAARSFLRNKRINLYIDNDTAPNTSIRGDCADPFLAAMIEAFFLRVTEKLQMDIWIGRMGLPVNPADPPTSNKTPHPP